MTITNPAALAAFAAQQMMETPEMKAAVMRNCIEETCRSFREWAKRSMSFGPSAGTSNKVADRAA